MYYRAPTYNIDTDQWTYTTFETKRNYRDYVDNQVKYPSKYNLKYTNGYWNRQAVIFNDTGLYPTYTRNSLDFKHHWNSEKEKCNFEGVVIYISEKENINFAIPGMFYFYLNYCPIYDKLKKGNFLPEIYDGDYHYYLYLLKCILHGKYGCVLKKRQSGYTLKNMSVLLLAIWFGNSAISKIFAFDEAAVLDSWNLMETYKQHINKYCAWERGFTPDKILDWQIKRKANDGSTKGNLSIAKGFTTKLDPSRGVGGNMSVLFGEEAGKNPTLDKTHNYVMSNVALGGKVTGLIIYSGAVGELTKCEPLKKYILYPNENNFMSCPNIIEDDSEFGAEVGFFAPEWWNYIDEDDTTGETVRFFDEWGNTDREGALAQIEFRRKKAKLASPEDYRYYCSQRPLSIKEAFDYRKESVFPQGLLTRQEYRIDRGDYPYELFDIERGPDGKPRFIPNVHPEVTTFPYRPQKDVIPFGCIKVFEKPIANAPWGTYFAGVDPIMVDITSTSESLFSIVIYKNLVEVKYIDEAGEEATKLEGDYVVAKYVGRKSEIKKVNELGELLIEMYNAFAVVENNVDNFIKHMIEKSKQKHLATKSDLPFLKELETNSTSYQEYGVRTNATLWVHYINKLLEYMKEEMSVSHKEDGSEYKTKYGVEKIKDKRMVRELLSFTDIKGNYDEIISFALVLCLAKSRQTNGLISKVDQRTDIKLDPNLYKINRKLFKHLDNYIDLSQRIPRNAFKNLK